MPEASQTIICMCDRQSVARKPGGQQGVTACLLAPSLSVGKKGIGDPLWKSTEVPGMPATVVRGFSSEPHRLEDAPCAL